MAEELNKGTEGAVEAAENVASVEQAKLDKIQEMLKDEFDLVSFDQGKTLTGHLITNDKGKALQYENTYRVASYYLTGDLDTIIHYLEWAKRYGQKHTSYIIDGKYVPVFYFRVTDKLFAEMNGRWPSEIKVFYNEKRDEYQKGLTEREKVMKVRRVVSDGKKRAII